MTDYKMRPVEGTIHFDGEMATKGFYFNKMCYSFNTEENRQAFRDDPEAYMEKYKLTEEQKQAVRDKDINRMLELGGSIYYMAKFAGIFGWNMQVIGGMQSGRTTEEFKAYLDSQGRGKNTMAKIIGGITTSHIPAIGVAMDKGLENDPYYRDLFAIYPPIRDWLNAEKPDIAVLFYNDHGLEMFLDKKPTYAIGCAPEYENADEGWGIKPIPPVTGETELSWHIVNHLIEHDFDPTVCQDIKVDHGATVPLTLLWPNHSYQGIKVIPVSINCERHPMPKPSRSYAFGQAIGDAIRCWEKDAKVVVLGTGGLSHQLDGPRAGILNAEFDNWCMDKLVSDPQAITQYSNVDLIEKGGAQMVEIAMWLAMRGCIKGEVEERLRNYVSPISNTAVGVQLLIPKD